MNDLLIKMLTGVLRVALVPVTNWLIAHQILTSDETLTLIAEIISWTIAVGWTLWAWYQAKRREQTALAMHPGATANDVTAAIKAGNGAPAATPPDVAPKLNF